MAAVWLIQNKRTGNFVQGVWPSRASARRWIWSDAASTYRAVRADIRDKAERDAMALIMRASHKY